MQRLSLVKQIGALIDKHGSPADIPVNLWERLFSSTSPKQVALHPAPTGCDDDLAEPKRCKVAQEGSFAIGGRGS